jgi:hypothetical protein
MAILFRAVTHSFANFPTFAADLEPEQFGGSGRDGLKLQQALHQGGFARTIGAEQSDCAPVDFKRDAIQGLLLAKDLRETLCLDYQLGSHSSQPV